MNDAERDAWLREALRHAPDSDALPPSGVSEAILLKARAAARAAAPAARRAGSRDAHANPLLALWNWLARPPVAAGFASVMAATLVGLMWWDRPMDETMVRAPAPVRERAEITPPAVAERAAPPAASMQADSPQPTSTPPGVVPSGSTSTGALASGEARRQPSAAAAPGNVSDGKEAASAKAVSPALKDEESAAEPKLQAKRKNDAPAPFPANEQQRQAETTTAASPEAAKKEADIGRLRADAMTQPNARPAAPPPAQDGNIAAAPAPAAPLPRSSIAGPAPAVPFQGGSIAAAEASAAATANRAEASATATANRADSALAKSAAAPARAAPPARDAAPSARNATDAAQDTLTPPAERAQRQRALTDSRDKDGTPLASSPPTPAPFRNEPARSRSDAAARADAAAKSTPLTAVIAAIAADPDRWSRQTAAGDIYPLEAGWRRWLAELDAAAAGRWRSTAPSGARADSTDRAAATRPDTRADAANRAGTAADARPARDRATADTAASLRLVGANRAVTVIRVEGASVHVETASESGIERWQATLDPAATDALRAAAGRLPP